MHLNAHTYVYAGVCMFTNDCMHAFAHGCMSEVVGGNGAQWSPLPGIQAQRPSPSHRTHDTTDQWRDLISVARAKVGGQSFSLPSSRKYAPSGWRVVSVFWFILARNYNGFVVDTFAECLSPLIKIRVS